MSATGIGAAVRRKEDQRFITGKGHYTDDVNRPGQCYAYFLRSPHAHARIKAIDGTAAAKMPGVLAVLTGAELAGDKIGNLICGWMITSKDGTQMKMAPHPALAHGKANHVGDAVAVILAETLAQARDAAEKVDVDYEPLPAVTDPAKAQADGAPQIHEVARAQHHLSVAPGRPEGRRGRVQVGAPRHPARLRQQPPGRPTRSSRARRSANTMPAPTASRFGTPRRTRTWRAWSFPPSSASRPSTSCA